MLDLLAQQSVNTPCSSYRNMDFVWVMINDLLGGTASMREAGVKYLPMEAAESMVGYIARKERTFLFNGLKRSIKTLVGKPFSEDVHIAKEIVDEPATWLQDIDKMGNDITSFARELFTIGLGKGLVHILCEYPSVPDRITLAQKEQLEIRPYLVAINPESLIGWQYVMDHGRPVLSQVRIRESIKRQVGDWGEEFVNRVRVFDRIEDETTGQSLVSYRVFEEQKDPQSQQTTKWVVIDSGYTTTDYIPLTTVYFGEKTDFMLAEPPLLDLAWLNIEHWQSSSDQRHILHIARVPIWFLKGYQPSLDDDGNPKDKIIIGPDRMIRMESPEADLKIVEHTGKAIEAGRVDLQDIEARMAAMGSELLKKKTPGEVTATESSHDNKAEDSDLSAMVKALEDGLTTAINFMYEWESKEAPKGKLVTINTDFGLTAQDAADLQTLYQSRMAGQISHPMYLKELQRRGVLAPSVDLIAELAAAKVDGPVIVPAAAITSKAGAGA